MASSLLLLLLLLAGRTFAVLLAFGERGKASVTLGVGPLNAGRVMVRAVVVGVVFAALLLGMVLLGGEGEPQFHQV